MIILKFIYEKSIINYQIAIILNFIYEASRLSDYDYFYSRSRLLDYDYFSKKVATNMPITEHTNTRVV